MLDQKKEQSKKKILPEFFYAQGGAKFLILVLMASFLSSLGGCCLLGIRIGCCPPNTTPISNEPISSTKIEHPNSKKLGGRILVGLALSGGGIRSAVFSTNVMEFLWKLTPPDSLFSSKEKGIFLERGKNFLEEVDYVSTCSGGSVAGGYYCLNRPETLSQDFFDHFRNEMEHHLIDTMSACDIVRVLSFYSYQTENLISFWDRLHFQQKTFGDLYEREKEGKSPLMVINSSSLSHQKRFIFSNEDLNFLKNLPVPDDFMDFEDIFSDLKKYRLSRSIAASACVPGLFRAITLMDFKNSTEERSEYVHLLDGGLEDNMAARILFQIFRHRLKKDPDIAGALIIIVDAAQPPDVKLKYYRNLEQAKSREGITTAMESIGLMMFRSTERIKSEMQQYEKSESRFKAIHINLDKRIALQIATDWTLSGMEGKEGEVLREQAEKGVKSAEPEIWNFLESIKKEKKK